MGHGIFGALGPAGAADDVFHVGELPEHVLHPVVHAVHLVQGRFGGKDGLQEKSALVQGRHEVTPDEQRKDQHGQGQDEGPQP